MSRIVAGRFDDRAEAEDMLDALPGEGFQRSEFHSFFVTTPGRRALYRVSIRVSNPGDETCAMETLQRYGARDIERTEGLWQAGDGMDFDRRVRPDRRSEKQAHAAQPGRWSPAMTHG